MKIFIAQLPSFLSKDTSSGIENSVDLRARRNGSVVSYEHLAHKIMVAQCRNTRVGIIYEAYSVSLLLALGEYAPVRENLKHRPLVICRQQLPKWALVWYHSNTMVNFSANI